MFVLDESVNSFTLYAMDTVAEHLSVEEREEARQLWEVLVLSGPRETKAAQQQMAQAHPPVQQALIWAIANGLRSQQELNVLPNPFAD